MAVDIYLWPVPADADPRDVRLRDPTAFGGGGAAAFVSATSQIVDDE